MSQLLTRRLALLGDKDHRALLSQGLRGVEREALRIDQQGNLALTPHPGMLGSALTHPQITTDYSEALLEFITPAEHDIAIGLAKLDAIHRFTYAALGDELLWSQSMPCRLPSEEAIPIAWYGKSHIGMLKHVYRRGLALRYGKPMQCIAGIHYNFSMAEEWWRRQQAFEGAPGSAMDFQSDSYVALIRNFRRYGWLLMYLFGASPALSANFPRKPGFHLEPLSDDTLYLPYATSLRMSDMGYQNNAQAGLTPHYNSLETYMKSLAEAVNEPYPPYVALGTQQNGEWIQINTNRLQIENEYYSTIRPKRVIKRGERPLHALARRGVQYVEVRCLDIDPFEPVGISLETARFMDAFLLYCALEESPLTSAEEGRENTENFSRVVKDGRRPGLLLRHDGVDVSLQSWGLTLLDQIQATADLLDAQRNDKAHNDALAAQRRKLQDPALTPSARVLVEIGDNGNSFSRFGLRQSLAHAAYFRARAPSADELAYFNALANESLSEQARLEHAQTGDFEVFVAQYQAGLH